MFGWLRKKLFKQPAVRESAEFGVVPDPGLANNNMFRQWIGIYQLVDRSARARGGNPAERPIDERMVFIARGLMRYNTYAQGFVNALRTHTLGANGFVHRFTGPCAKECQSWLTKWKDETDWWQREREIYERVHIEGEAIPRFFVDGGCVQIRMIEPEWVIAPDGSEEWTYGFYNEPGDVEMVTALYAQYGATSEVVDWNDWYHVKSKLCVRADKRGRSDFLPSAQLLDDSFKVWRNFANSEAVRQGIIYFAKQAEGVTAEDLEQAIAAESDYTPPSPAGARRLQTPISLAQGAGVEYLQAGTELAAVPGSENISSAMTGVNAALLAVGRAYHMPLVLMSGDMSANNTLDFGDESPFGMTVADEQRWYSRHVRNILWRAMELAADTGEVPEEALYDGTNLEVATERKPGRDAEKNTQRAKTLYDDGVISARERSAAEGYDYDEQQAQRQREALPTMVEMAQQQQPLLGGFSESVNFTERMITVHRDGKTFQEKRKVRVKSKDFAKHTPVVHHEHLEDEPGADKAALKHFAEHAPTEAAKEAILDAEWNVRSENHDIPPDYRRAQTVERLAASWRDQQKLGDRQAADYVRDVMGHFGATLHGPQPGEVVDFDGSLYEADFPILSGEAKVVRQPVVVEIGDVKHVALQGKVVKVGDAEDTQLVTVHRDGKTFQERREKGKSKPKLADRAKAVAAAVKDKAAELIVRLSPAAYKVASVLGVIFDTPEDMKKFAYNPSTTGSKAATNDFVSANLNDAFGVGVSGHIVAHVAAQVLSRAVMYAKKKLSGQTEDSDAGVAEFAEFMESIYKLVMEELGVDSSKAPKAADIAKNLAALLRS